MPRSTTKIAGSAVSAAKKVIGRRGRAEEAEEAAAAAKPAATKAAPAKKAAAKKAPAKKAAAKKAAPAKKAAATPSTAATAAATATKAAASTTRKAASTAKKAAAPAAKKATTTARKAAATAKKAAPVRKSGPVKPETLPFKEGEEAWTKADLDEVIAELKEHAERLRQELHDQEEELAGLLKDAGDGAGHDQADMGATSFERDHELTVVNNSREMLAQTERALDRIADGTYGVCESCGQPIGKMRVMAFPRATLCMDCKKREERR
ncbi:TraR/DksA family transcriptional regulator [Nocardioides jiangxiensis]|uniref:TraR/DksA C4-type zinc finger protein n=1 Tax=Nocardioides jiangxiensis TaxID=3064524 RepID=A0ABT9B4N4_9ACTN|nr:TraR/DksA C4-type zinc finger protein [Nocardioides sp. WY-20]MDO7869355.1 TraR/DksA C4-type zinc finger protein [Nocardioides sp. WY-20]